MLTVRSARGHRRGYLRYTWQMSGWYVSPNGRLQRRFKRSIHFLRGW